VRWLSIGVVALLELSALPAQDLPDWVLQLSRAKHHARSNFERLPNYACFQTVERFDKGPRDRVFRPLDTLHLEVAFVGGKELYARGGGHFDAESPSDLISTGAFGTGTFTSTARNLFVLDASRPTGWSREYRDGKPEALRFDFEISQMKGPLTLQTGSVTAVVGERGSFWVDPESLDLLEIEDHAVDIPPELLMIDSQTNIRYAKVRIGSSDVILPRTAEMLVLRSSGGISRNVSEFSGCREYGSESTITFGDDPPLPQTAPPPPPPAKKRK
jgi:hypothetical protein